MALWTRNFHEVLYYILDCSCLSSLSQVNVAINTSHSESLTCFQSFPNHYESVLIMQFIEIWHSVFCRQDIVLLFSSVVLWERRPPVLTLPTLTRVSTSHCSRHRTLARQVSFAPLTSPSHGRPGCRRPSVLYWTSLQLRSVSCPWHRRRLVRWWTAPDTFASLPHLLRCGGEPGKDSPSLPVEPRDASTFIILSRDESFLSNLVIFQDSQDSLLILRLIAKNLVSKIDVRVTYDWHSAWQVNCVFQRSCWTTDELCDRSPQLLPSWPVRRNSLNFFPSRLQDPRFPVSLSSAICLLSSTCFVDSRNDAKRCSDLFSWSPSAFTFTVIQLSSADSNRSTTVTMTNRP